MRSWGFQKRGRGLHALQSSGVFCLLGRSHSSPVTALPGAAADRPHTRLHVCSSGTGQWETSAQRDEPRPQHLKPRPSTFKALTWPFRSSPFKKSPFLRLSLLPMFLELSHRGSVPTPPGQAGYSPWPRLAALSPEQAASLALHSNSNFLPDPLLRRSCMVCWALSPPCSGLHHTTSNTVKPFLHWPGLLPSLPPTAERLCSWIKDQQRSLDTIA